MGALHKLASHYILAMYHKNEKKARKDILHPKKPPKLPKNAKILSEREREREREIDQGGDQQLTHTYA